MIWSHMNHPPCSTESATPMGFGWKTSSTARASGVPSKTSRRNTKRSTLLLLLPPASPGGLSLSTSKHDATYPRPVHLPKVYSPKCLEEEFCELRELEILRSPRSPGPTPMSVPDRDR